VEIEKPDHVTKKADSASAPNPAGWREFFSRGSTLLTIIGALVAMIAGFLSFTTQSFENARRSQILAEAEKIRAEQLDKLAEKIASLGSDLNALRQHISSISNIPKEDALNIELQKLGSSFKDLNSREAKLETVILENPAKALEMPLLRRDLDNVKDVQQAALVNLKDSVDRIYDLNKWLLGAMAVSIVTLATGNLLKSKETKS
jgi:hypothetical protein